MLTGYNGIFNVTNKNNKFFSTKSIIDKDGFVQITIQSGYYAFENLNIEVKRITFEEGHSSDAVYSFTVKLNFLTLGSIIGFSRQEPLIAFNPDDSIRELLGFNPGINKRIIFYHLIQLIYYLIMILS